MQYLGERNYVAGKGDRRGTLSVSDTVNPSAQVLTVLRDGQTQLQCLRLSVRLFARRC